MSSLDGEGERSVQAIVFSDESESTRHGETRPIYVLVDVFYNAVGF